MKKGKRKTQNNYRTNTIDQYSPTGTSRRKLTGFVVKCGKKKFRVEKTFTKNVQVSSNQMFATEMKSKLSE